MTFLLFDFKDFLLLRLFIAALSLGGWLIIIGGLKRSSTSSFLKTLSLVGNNSFVFT